MLLNSVTLSISLLLWLPISSHSVPTQPGDGDKIIEQETYSEAVIDKIIFLGTGSSSCLPDLKCLTDSLFGGRECEVCEDGYYYPKGKNKRTNTSLLVQIKVKVDNMNRQQPSPDDLTTATSLRSDISTKSILDEDEFQIKNIIIDVGKSFREQVLATFFKCGIKTIDAVILTHDHADATFGLDDLRGWPHGELPVYLSRRTLEALENTFPYLADTKKATGSGVVPKLKFIPFGDDDRKFTLFGVDFIPLKVEHGEYSNGEPYYCYGFRFGTVSYVSDVSFIPDKAFNDINGSEIVILDALAAKYQAKSHLSIPEALTTLTKFRPRPKLGLLTGFVHNFFHHELLEICDKFSKTGKLESIDDLHLEGEDRRTLTKQYNCEGMVIKPAYDGLKIEFPLRLYHRTQNSCCHIPGQYTYDNDQLEQNRGFHNMNDPVDPIKLRLDRKTDYCCC